MRFSFNGGLLYDALRKVRDVRFRLRGAWVKNANKRSALILVAIAIPIAILYFLAFSPPADFPSGTIVTIEAGSTLSEVADELQSDHLIRYADALKLYVKLIRGDRSIVAGDYQFSSPADIFSIAHTITTGTFGLVPIRIQVTEGTSVAQMANIFAAKLPRFDKAAFIAEAKPLEGFLFPDTYFFLPNADDKVVIRTMLANFDLQTEPLKTQVAASGHTMAEIVTMASILEKEARIYSDRQKIAGVLWRRISIGMPLQVDAVFLYYLGRTTFDLTLADLASDSPYNTYTHKGLPPTPIDSPGLSSIKAALNPIDTGALFYLADNNGVTHFSKTYQQHLELKAEYLGS